MKARLTTLLLALLVGGLVAGCGGDETKDAGDPGPAEAAEQSETDPAPRAEAAQTIENPADPSGKLAFEKTKLSAKAGEVTLVMDNPSSVPHAIALRGPNTDNSGQTVQKGGKSEVSAALKPGEYEFYCPVPGHEPAGMKGTLTVK